MIRIAAIFLIAVAGCSPQTGAPPAMPVKPMPATPMRIVSMNPCVDSILMEVARPDQIAAISHYSHDPRATSVPMKWAMQYPAVSDGAEDVIAAQPDLVIAGPHVSVQTIAALNRLKIPLLKIAVPESVEQSKAQISNIAGHIGRYSHGAALNTRIDAAIASARPGTVNSARPVTALIWQGGGLVPGKGTLADEMLTIAGFRNVSDTLGLKKWDVLPIEGMLSNPPAVVFAGQAKQGAGSADANRMLSHPVLQQARSRIQIAHYPSSLLHCGGPTIIKSVSRLANVRRSLGAKI